MNEGWKCPVCGRGVAPSERHCDHGGGLFTLHPPFTTTPVHPQTTWIGDPLPVTCGSVGGGSAN